MIWPFDSWFTEHIPYKVPQLKEVWVGNRRYDPQANITPHEVALLLPVFMMAYGLSREEYIKDNNLERHFVEVEE